MAADEIEILLVEDNPADVELTLHALRQNHLANPMGDGEEALDYLFARGAYGGWARKRPLKLVLLDLKLPKVDGLEVLRAVKGDSRLKVTPVVVLTNPRPPAPCDQGRAGLMSQSVNKARPKSFA